MSIHVGDAVIVTNYLYNLPFDYIGIVTKIKNNDIVTLKQLYLSGDLDCKYEIEVSKLHLEKAILPPVWKAAYLVYKQNLLKSEEQIEETSQTIQGVAEKYGLSVNDLVSLLSELKVKL